MDNIENKEILEEIKEESKQEIDYKAEYEKIVSEIQESKFNRLIEEFNTQLRDTLTDNFLNKVSEHLKTNDYENAKKTIELIKEASDFKNHKIKPKIKPNILHTGTVLEPNQEKKTFEDIIIMERKNK